MNYLDWHKLVKCMKTKQQIEQQILANKFKLLIMQLHLFNMRGNYPEMRYEPNITILEDSFGNKMHCDGFVVFKPYSGKTADSECSLIGGNKYAINIVCINIEYKYSMYNEAVQINGKISNRLNHWEQKLRNLNNE